MATLITQGKFTFDDGAAGHLCDMGSAPAAGQTDILCINSDTVVTSVSASFLQAEAAVTNQGAYIYDRKAVGGEGQTFVVTTGAGTHNTQVTWQRWSGLDARDTATSTQANASVGVVTPPHSTGVLADTDEVVVAFGALHSIGSANQNTPDWTLGSGVFTPLPLVPAIQGSGATGVAAFVAYKTGAGTAAETPQVGWSGDGAQNRYMLTVSYTTVEEDIASEGVGGVAVAGTGESAAETASAGVGGVAVGGSGESTIAVALTALNFITMVTGIGACVADGLEVDSLGGRPCRICLAVAGSIVADDCGCTCGDNDDRNGQLAVTVTRIFPSATLWGTAVDDGRQSRCGVPFLVAEIHVQVHRCVHTLQEGGAAPTCDQLLADAVIWHSDAAAVRKAVGCCVRAMRTAKTIKDFALGETVPLGEEGGCTGSDLRVYVAIANCICPD
jgi:hypothetical protein